VINGHIGGGPAYAEGCDELHEPAEMLNHHSKEGGRDRAARGDRGPSVLVDQDVIQKKKRGAK